MITLKEIINSIDFEDKKIQTSPDWEDLAAYFNIYDLGWSNDERLKAYHIKTWLCTDSWVGWNAYFLDNEFVCVSSQNARKSDTEFDFISKEIGLKVYEYLLSLIRAENEPTIDILDLDAEIPERFKIEYNSQILHKSAWYVGQKVKIKRTSYPHGQDSNKYFHTVEIEMPNESTIEVDCRELEFEYNNLN